MKKQITKKEWLKDVAKEVEALKKNATPEEIARLDFETFDPDNRTRCIYGQMAEHCANDRAIELIHKCCNRFTEFESLKEDEDVIGRGAVTFSSSRDGINGNVPTSRERFGLIRYFSSIEHYILLSDSKPENIIKYLKGETKTLEL